MSMIVLVDCTVLKDDGIPQAASPTQAQAISAAQTAAAPDVAAQQTARTNAATLQAAAQNALATNVAFLGFPSPTNAQVLTQVQALTRACSAMIRLLVGALDSTTGI